MTETKHHEASIQKVATSAGLVYVEDGEPGFTRRRNGSGFRYLDQHGRPIKNSATVTRLRSLAVPPAWTDVWFCPDPDGHIQATGRDAKSRKQYRYHERWSETRKDAKFDSLGEFGHSLPVLRKRVDDDTRLRGLPMERVVATVVRLLDRTLIRVGNEEYARADETYGLTTLRNKHVRVSTQSVVFHFTGKSGRKHDVSMHDRRVANVVRQCHELPGQRLFQYTDGDEVRSVTSRDVNDYIRDVTGSAFSAKTFRTWGGSVYALHYLSEARDSEGSPKQQIHAAIKATASELRNTPTVCRQSYIHPAVLQLADEHPEIRGRDTTNTAARNWLSADERDLLRLLDHGCGTRTP
jgi:DNA topoisomerase I